MRIIAHLYRMYPHRENKDPSLDLVWNQGYPKVRLRHNPYKMNPRNVKDFNAGHY